MTKDSGHTADAARLRARIEQAIATGEEAQGLAEGVLQTLQRAKDAGEGSFILSAIMMTFARGEIRRARKALEGFQEQLDQLGLKHGASLGESRVVLDPRSGFALGLRVDGAIIRARATGIRVRSALETLRAALAHQADG